ncbi:MAG TPA: hypothetical protein HA268_01775 [Candidatus Poseidoniaceae archaeon]|nr:hypothetical protein [Candidatus Poseidoniaceae archaeon]
MSGVRRQCGALLVAALIGLLTLTHASAHEQETYNIIVVADGPMPANITDSGFVQGNIVVFRMKDTTENASIRVTIDTDQDGVFNSSTDDMSVWLVQSCELTENGTLVDETCAVSHSYEFNINATVGDYGYLFERAINESIVTNETYTISLQKDVHEEPGVPTLGECFGIGCEADVVAQEVEESQTELLIIVMGVAIVGIIGLSISIMNESKELALEDSEE